MEDVNKQTAELVAFLGLSGMERAEAALLSYGGQRLLDMGLAIATRPRILLLDEPLAGLAAAERTRVASLLSTLAAEIPVLLVEHDIDRVFQIADHVTVMNEGKVLVDGTVEDARNDAKVREVYIGSGVAALAAKPRVSAAAAASHQRLGVRHRAGLEGASHSAADSSRHARRSMPVLDGRHDVRRVCIAIERDLSRRRRATQRPVGSRRRRDGEGRQPLRVQPFLIASAAARHAGRRQDLSC